MKRAFKSFSHRLIPILLLSIALISCEKTDSDLVGEWHLTEMNYLITANQDFIFNDVFGESWQGTIRINDEKFNTESFSYYFNNVWPTNQFGSEELVFSFAGPQLEIYLRDEHYVLESYEFDISSGIFSADGMAKGNNQSVRVVINTTMPKIILKKGQQATVRDGYYRMPYTNIWLKSGGKLQTDYLSGDILDRLSGNWSVKNNRITLSLKNHKDDMYQYNFNGNELILSKGKVTEEEFPSNLSPFAEKISDITYLAIYGNM